jgi:hypothetical protein
VSIQNLIIYRSSVLHSILEELSLNFNYKIYDIEDENSLNDKIKNLNNYLIISSKKLSYIDNQLILYNTPINISKLLEKINIEFLKLHFNNQSKIKISRYTIDINSKTMQLNDAKLKLTEKEINIILYLSKSDNSVDIDELQKKVWSYQSEVETHTVETHIYRLRKKIFKIFDDDQFIISEKKGYLIKKL